MALKVSPSVRIGLWLFFSFMLLVLSWWMLIKPKGKELKPVIHLSVDQVIEHFDPAKAYSDDSLTISAQVMETLYNYHYLKRPYELMPMLAQAMPTISEDQKIYTIKIKPDIFYHQHPAFNGAKRKVVAQDFVNQFKRIAFKPLASPFWSFFAETIIGFKEFSQLADDDWKKMLQVTLSGVVAVDENTLEIKLTKPEPNLIYYLSMNMTAPIPAEVITFLSNDLKGVLIGSGPFQYKDFENNRYHLVANPDYREDFYPTVGDRYANIQNYISGTKEKIPFLKEVYFHVITEESQRWEKMLKLELDILSVPKTYLPQLFLKGNELEQLIGKKKLELKHFPILANRWLAFNMQDPVWGSKVDLRKAIAFGIDRDAYLQQFSQKTSLKAHSILVPGIPGYNPSRELPFVYDLNKAKELLKKAGYENGQGLKIKYSTRGNQATHYAEADFFKQQLNRLGIEVEIEYLAFSDFLSKGRAGQLQLFTDNWWFDYPDGENILQLLISSNSPGINKSGYSKTEVDQLYEKLRLTLDTEEKVELMNQIEDQVFYDLPWIPLMYESSYVLHRADVKNFRKSSVVRNFVKYLKVYQGE